MDRTVLVICTSLNMGVQKNKPFGFLINYLTMVIECFCFFKGFWGTFESIKFKHSCKKFQISKSKNVYSKMFYFILGLTDLIKLVNKYKISKTVTFLFHSNFVGKL